MTPEAWFAATNPVPLFAAALEDPANRGSRAPAFVRRLRLFNCATARQVWDLLSTDARSAVQASERYAEGRATRTDLIATALEQQFGTVTATQLARMAALEANVLVENDPRLTIASDLHVFILNRWIASSMYAARAVATRDVGPAPPGRPTTPEWHAAWTAAFDAARATQADYFRDIIPPPRYQPKRNPQWITSTVLALARQMDDSGDFSAVPILADALQDAGCDDETLLGCCRTAGNNHVRGNWVVELVLERL
jgi:hypothetical protein